MKGPDPRLEDRLRERLAEDLDGSFSDLVVSYQDRLFAFTLRMAGNREDAEETAQDALVRAYGALRRYSAEQIRSLAVKPWLYRIALNVCRNRWRVNRGPTVSLDHESQETHIDLPDDASRQPDAVFERSEEGMRVAQLVSSLPPRYRVAVVLRYVQELSYREISHVLEQPVGTAKANVHRGIRLLRAELANQGRDGWIEWRHTDDRERSTVPGPGTTTDR